MSDTDHSLKLPIRTACGILKVAKSQYYDWRQMQLLGAREDSLRMSEREGTHVAVLHLLCTGLGPSSLVVGRVIVAGSGVMLHREVRFDVYDLVDMSTLTAFDQHLHRAVGQLQHLQDVGYRADSVKIFGRGLVLGRGFLSD